MAKIIANDKATKLYLTRKRAYKMRQSGHDCRWIAQKLGISEVSVRTLLTV